MPESASLAKSSCNTSEFFMYWTFAAPSLNVATVRLLSYVVFPDNRDLRTASVVTFRTNLGRLVSWDC